MKTELVDLKSKGGLDAKIGWLAEICQKDCETTASVYADWLADNGQDGAAECQRFMANLLGAGASARMDLGALADEVVSKVSAFKIFTHNGTRNPADDSRLPDESLEFAMLNGYVPTLRKRSANCRLLGKILTAMGFKVFWI